MGKIWHRLNERNDIKFIQNKMGRKRVKIYERGNDEGSVTEK